MSQKGGYTGRRCTELTSTVRNLRTAISKLETTADECAFMMTWGVDLRPGVGKRARERLSRLLALLVAAQLAAAPVALQLALNTLIKGQIGSKCYG